MLRESRGGHVPLSRQQWGSLVVELAPRRRLKRLGDQFVQVAEYSSASGRAIARLLRPATERLADEADAFASLLKDASIFVNSDSSDPTAVHMIGTGFADCLDEAALWLDGGLTNPMPPPPVFDPGEWESVGVDNPLMAAFGVPGERLFDEGDAVSDARLLAQYRERLPMLTERCGALLVSVTEEPTEPFATLSPLIQLLRAPSPLAGWDGARTGLAMLEKADANPARLRGILVALRVRRNARTASLRRVAGTRAHAQTGNSADRALAAVSTYRMLSEGQLRPWAWALLRMEGADGDLPLLSTLRDQLQASEEPFLRAISKLILPAVRNADAHEDAYFNEATGHVAIGGAEVAVAEIETVERKMQSTIAGLEVALSIAIGQLRSAQEAYELRPGDLRTGAEALEHAKQRYGHAGLSPWSIDRDRGTVRVVLDQVPPRGPNPCFVATMQAHNLLAGVSRWQIALRDADRVVLDLSARALEVTYPVFLQAADWFDRLPVGTFLPCNTWARLAMELPGEALRAAAWSALNDIQDAIDQVEQEGQFDPALFDLRLRNTAAAVAGTLRLMPPEEADPLLHAQHFISSLRASLAGLPATPPLSVMVRRVLVERDLLPTPAAMPTLDPRSVKVVEEEELGSAFNDPKPASELVSRRRGEPLGGVWRPSGPS